MKSKRQIQLKSNKHILPHMWLTIFLGNICATTTTATRFNHIEYHIKMSVHTKLREIFVT